MFDWLKHLLSEQGALSGLIINEAADLPSSSANSSRSGSFLRADTLVGYHPRRDCRYIEINRRLREMHPSIVQDVLNGIHAGGGRVVNETSGLLRLNEELTLSIAVARCTRQKMEVSRGKNWREWSMNLPACNLSSKCS